MTRLPNRDAIYQAAQLFSDRCLTGTGSLLWSGKSPWTAAALAQLWECVVVHPDTGKRTFFEKLHDQLASADEDTLKVTVEILAFYYLYPINTGATKKVARLREVADWKGLADLMNLSAVQAAFNARGIGNPGAYYNTGLHWNFSFLIGLGRELIAHPDARLEADALEELTARIMTLLSPNSTSLIRNVALHLLLPDSFERLGTDDHKNMVLAAFSEYDPQTGSIDQRLRIVRQKLGEELGRSEFDFYDRDIKPRWLDSDDEPGPPPVPPERRVWIEKTIVAGRRDRLDGPHALGKALWSPQRSKNGSDIYRTMREVQAGDLVLHLTDNEAFTGISVADGGVDDTFTGVPGTEWGDVPGYRIALRAFRHLSPPLSRDVFFAPPFRVELVKYAEGEGSNLFYNSEPSLNQGKYLTEAPARLVAILNAAYQSVCGKNLVESRDEVDIAPLPTTITATAAEFAASCRSFSGAMLECGLSFGTAHESLTRSFFVSLATKRLVILTGLSGSGKTQLAIRFGEWIGDSRSLVVPVRPDWTGAESLFGFEDALQKAVNGRKAWQVSEALQFMIRAAADKSQPYLLVLDEMNLAHVERYFADVLSGMESGKDCLPNLAKEADGQWRLKPSAREKIPIPANLFVVGTVNVDETTYMFSPKVLDRANTFEFRVRTSDLSPFALKPRVCSAGTDNDVGAFLAVASNMEWHAGHLAEEAEAFAASFKKLHELLSVFGLEYGHRTLMEAMRFTALLRAAGDTDLMSALDLQIMQKILPRLHGSRRRLEPVLCRLGEYCVDPSVHFAQDPAGQVPTFDPLQFPIPTAKLPLAFDKVRRMTSLLRANQFVSFTE